ncbi:hypothetical protein FOZ63_034140, partial [Perkinsus olseni]
NQQQRQLFGRHNRRLHYNTTPLTPIHELREMTSSEMSDYCPTVVSSSEGSTEGPFRNPTLDGADRRRRSRRRSDPGGRIRAVGSSMVSLRRLASSSGTEGPGFTAYVEAIKARKLTDEMAMELTAALRSEERRGADPTGACLTAAMYLGVVRSTSQIPRLFLATALPDIEAESMASITKVVTLEEVKSILQRLLKEDGNQLTMEAAVRAVVFLHHNRVEVTDSMLDVVLAAHQSALAAVVNGNITKKEYLEELAESMKVMKYFSKNKAAREGFLPYYQRAVSAITRSGYYGEGLVEVLLRVGRLLRLRTFT